MNTLDCACGATLDVSAFEPGTEFACGSCGAGLKVPAKAAPAAKPATRSGPKAAAPAAKKARPPRAPAGAKAEGGDAGKKKTVVMAAGVGGVLLLGVVAFLVLKPKSAPTPAEAPPAPVALKPKEPPKKELPPDEAEWLAAKTPEEKEAVAVRRTAESSSSDAASKELFRFLVGKGRTDLAKKAAQARVAADPESPWGNETLGRTSAKAALEEFGATATTLDLVPPEGWDRMKKRIADKRVWVEVEEKKQYDDDLASVRRQVKALEDPWYKEALGVVAGIRADPRFRRFLPIDFIAQPPYLVMAQHQNDPMRMATSNVLQNHSKFFKCLTGEFLKIMAEAGLPTPTVAEMGNPVLKAFVFIDRGNFDVWHGDQGQDPKTLAGVRAYYSWFTDQYMMMYDTGASSELQSDDTCTAFHEATHQLVHYYRRYYLTQKLRELKPDMKELALDDFRLNGQSHWFGEGFAEFFGAADRISTQTGEWRLLRPLRKRLQEWGDPIVRKPEKQWSLEEVLQMKGRAHMEQTARKKWPDTFQEMNSLYYAEAWALNHYLYFGKDGAYRAKYLKIIHEEMLCHSGSEMFFEVMEAGTGDARKKWLEDLEDELKDYVRKLIKGLK